MIEKIPLVNYWYHRIGFSFNVVKASTQKDFGEGVYIFLKELERKEDYATSFHAAAVLAKYVDTKAMPLMFNLAMKNKRKVKKMSKIMRNNDVFEAIGKYKDSKYLPHIASRLLSWDVRTAIYCGEELLFEGMYEGIHKFSKQRGNIILDSIFNAWSGPETIELFEKIPENYIDPLISKTVLDTDRRENSVGNYRSVLKIIERYKDNHCKELCNSLMKINNLHSYKLNPLKQSWVFELIERSRDAEATFDWLIHNNIPKNRGMVEDEKVRDNLTYDDHHLMTKTLKLISEIHKKRDHGAIKTIEQGFKEELNRSVSLGYNLQSKLGYLRRYCSEVTDKMKNQASDLMVVTNA